MAFDALRQYKARRNFSVTSEPAAGGQATAGVLSFVIQKHWASHLHYDFRLELDGTMKSWVVPKGPSLDTRDKRMAVQVEDHPIAYSNFEGTIPAGQYGAGKVIIWDRGTWQPVGDAARGYLAGQLKFELHGQKLHGKWVLVRMKGKGEKQPPWLLIKETDEFVRLAAEFSVVDERPDSVEKPSRPGRKSGLKQATVDAAKTAARKTGTRRLVRRRDGHAQRGWRARLRRLAAVLRRGEDERHHSLPVSASGWIRLTCHAGPPRGSSSSAANARNS